MQSRPTSRLAAKMGRYAKKHSRRETALKFRILDPDGHPAKSLVTLLLNGYEPKKPETRLRLGLPPELPKPVHRRTINDHLATDAISDMPAPLIRYAFDHRTEVTE